MELKYLCDTFCISIYNTPEELSWRLWTSEKEENVSFGLDRYRRPFVVWIKEYANGIRIPHGESYASISHPYLFAHRVLTNPFIVDFNQAYFEELCIGLTKWIEMHKARKMYVVAEHATVPIDEINYRFIISDDKREIIEKIMPGTFDDKRSDRTNCLVFLKAVKEMGLHTQLLNELNEYEKE